MDAEKLCLAIGSFLEHCTSFSLDDDDDRTTLGDELTEWLLHDFVVFKKHEDVAIYTYLPELIAKQGWNDDSIKMLAFVFIEKSGLGQQFKDYVTQAAKEENDGNAG